MNHTDRRYVVVSPDCSVAAGFDTLEGAEAAALAFGEGAHLVDTRGQPYQPSVTKVEKGALVLVGYGSFDQRLGLDANLIEAVKKGYPPIVKAFLARGADADAADGNGGTALLWGVAGADADVVRLLIEAGADVAHPDAEGTTPLAMAAERNRREIADILRAAGAGA